MSLSLMQFRELNKEILDLLNIPVQWKYTTGRDIKVILGTSGPHGEKVLRIIKAIAPDIEHVYKARDVTDAVNYAIKNGIKLINFSKYETPTAERIAALDTMPEDILFTAASGNWGGEITFPANHPNVFSVANYQNLRKNLSKQSNVGPEMDVTMPGHWVAHESGHEDTGTSYANGANAGVLGLLQRVFLDILGRWPTRSEIRILYQKYSRDIVPGTERDGAGLFVFPAPHIWIGDVEAIGKKECQTQEMKEKKEQEKKLNIDIVEELYSWNGNLTKRSTTDHIVLHHAALCDAGPQDIHRLHLSNGWAGIGYHFYVVKNGTVYRGRPLNSAGAQCQGCNSRSIGICAEGDYQHEIMSEAQKVALAELLRYVMELYPQARVVGHRDLNATACPGDNYPFDEILVLARQEGNQEGEGAEMVRYQKLSDIPNDYGFRDIVGKLMDAKIINGDGSDPAGNDDVIDLSHDQVRTIVMLYRGGAFDRKLIAAGMKPAVNI